MSIQPSIDFVIPWVNGSDKKHREKRQRYAKSFNDVGARDFEQSLGEQRFVEHNELKYCLRSIVNHAPWYNNIWLITDQQVPDFLKIDKLNDARIKIIDHKLLFSGNEHVLPIFNTRSILTNMDRIIGLADIAIIGNDDTFLANEITPEYFINNGTLNIYAEPIQFDDHRFDSLHFDALKLTAKMLDVDVNQYLMMSHGFMPISMVVFRHLREQFPEQFTVNSQHRFRHKSQFLVEALISQRMLDSGEGVLSVTQKIIPFSFDLCRRGTEIKLKFLFSLLREGHRNMFCLNDFGALVERFDWAEPALEGLCGPPLHC